MCDIVFEKALGRGRTVNRMSVSRCTRPKCSLTLIWVGSLGVCFEGEGGVKLPPSLKLVRIVLETSNLASNYTLVCSFRKYTF